MVKRRNGSETMDGISWHTLRTTIRIPTRVTSCKILAVPETKNSTKIFLVKEMLNARSETE